MISRVQIAALTLSAAGLIGIAVNEGYTDRAVQPLPGDKWTQGFGSTTRDDGTPVRPTDKTTPVRALIKLQADTNAKEREVKACLGNNVEMYQHEWDFVMDFVYNIGSQKFCNSTMAELFRRNQHEAACRQVLRWTMFQGKDCRIRSNKCYGLVERREREMNKCFGLQAH